MTDVFDTTMLCKKCGEEMERTLIRKSGSELRAVECPKCKDTIIHPADLSNFQNYNNIKDKTFHVKLRMVGNSHAISIPKEIVEFMHQQEKMMDDMVRLCFEDMRNLRVRFGDNL
jgi:DNA-directed RNA polymerase subunit RPC12/RpoP